MVRKVSPQLKRSTGGSTDARDEAMLAGFQDLEPSHFHERRSRRMEDKLLTVLQLCETWLVGRGDEADFLPELAGSILEIFKLSVCVVAAGRASHTGHAGFALRRGISGRIRTRYSRKKELPNCAACDKCGTLVTYADVERSCESRFASRPGSQLCTPIKDGSEFLGVLHVAHGDEHCFTANEIAAFEALSGIVGLCFRQHPERAATRALRKSFYRVGAALSTGVDIKDTLDIVVRLAADLTEAKGAAVLVNEATGLRLIASTGIDGDRVARAVMPMESSVAGLAIRTGDLQHVDNLEKSVFRERLLSTKHCPVNHVVCVPIPGKKNLAAGAIEIFEPRLTSKKQALQFLTDFSHQVSVALDHAHLFQSEKARRQEKETLLEVAEAASSTLDLTSVLRRVAQYVSGVLGVSRCAVFILSGGVFLEPLVLKGQWKKSVDGLALDLRQETFCRRTLEEKKPMVLDGSEPERMGPGERRLFSEQDMRRLIAVPISHRHRPLGLILADQPGCSAHFGRNQIDLVVGISRLTGIATDNAKLFEEALRREKRTALLEEANRLFTSSLRIRDILETVATRTGDVLAAKCSILLKENKIGDLARGRELELTQIGDLVVVAGQLEEDQRQVITQVINTKKPCAFMTETTKGPVSVIGVPLLVKDELLGVLWCDGGEKRPFEEADLRLAQSLGSRAALAIENSRLYEREYRLAKTLEKALLPTELPKVAGVRFSVRYQSATMDAGVGGDFYDIFEISDRRVAIVVGDVCGKGVEATAQAALIRYMLRGFASEISSPSIVLARLNDAFLSQAPMVTFGTVFYGLLDSESGTLRYSRAGHPPALVYRQRQGRIQSLGTGGLAIGVLFGERYPEKSTELEPGDLLVAFSDGVTEARRGSEFFGPKRLRKWVGENHALGPSGLAAGLARECMCFSEGRSCDDIVILALQRTRSRANSPKSSL